MEVKNRLTRCPVGCVAAFSASRPVPRGRRGFEFLAVRGDLTAPSVRSDDVGLSNASGPAGLPDPAVPRRRAFRARWRVYLRQCCRQAALCGAIHHAVPKRLLLFALRLRAPVRITKPAWQRWTSGCTIVHVPSRSLGHPTRQMARRLSLPPSGFLQVSAFASLTTSGHNSAWLLRPSIFSPVVTRLRLRAAASFATRVVLSSAIAPRTCRTRIAVGVSYMNATAGSDDGSVSFVR